MQLITYSNITADRLLSVLQIPLLQQLLLVFLFSGLLSIAFLDSDRFYLTWFAFVPLLFAIEKATLTKTYFLGVIAGLSLFMSGTYWIADFITIVKGSSESSNLWLAFVYWLYCAHLIAFLLLLFNWLRKNTRVHDFILFPFVVAALTSAFPMLFAMRLGESQVNFYSALQATEFLGVHALDAIIALFNIVVFRFLSQQFATGPKLLNQSRWPWAIAISLITLWFTYGVMSYSFWEKEITNWDTLKIGMVQPNEIPKLGKKIAYPGYSNAYPPEIEMTQRLTSIGAEIIVWPEAHPKGYLDNSRIRTAYQKNIEKLGSSLLFQDLQQILDPTNGNALSRYNSAIMLDDNGHQIGRYNKIKRIPFGEYIPILNDGSSLKNWTEDFLEGFLNKFSRGENHQLFRHEKINIIPVICYETTFPDFVGSAVSETAAQANKSNGTLLVGLSNDGWFGSTNQPYQHIMASVLRAVENRLPLVHVANNGPSIAVTPSGKIIIITDFQQAGGYIVDVPYSNTAQGSFYSRHPTLFTNFLYGVIVLITFNALFRIIYRNTDSNSKCI